MKKNINNEENKKYLWFMKFLIMPEYDLLKIEIELSKKLAKILIIFEKIKCVSLTIILNGNSIKLAKGYLCRL
tara:strand:- start:39 stop:257 length:219 start_codon:yes stop_codon:yes gene_type:complete